MPPDLDRGAGTRACRVEARLDTLLSVIVRDNPFYAAKLRGFTPDADLAALPFTCKQELIEDQIAHPPYGSNLTYPLHRYTRFCQTSATTTGTPMRWLDTPESWDWMTGNWTRVYQAAGVTAGDRIFFAFSFGPFLGFWVGFEAAARVGCLAIPGGGMRSAARLRTLIETSATVLCCTPTYAIRLAEVAAEENIDLPAASVRTLIVAGEPGGSVPATRGHISKLWRGARVVDHHGMTEIGPVSYGCPKRPGVLHVIADSYIAEVIDPLTGQPVPRGVTGELVLTNLGRLGSPLLRYRTSDIVQAAPEVRCECGTADLALNGGILGRTDDMLVVRGVNVYPSAVENILRGFDAIAEYRVEIQNHRTLPELSIRVEAAPAHAHDSTLPHRLEAALTNAFALRIPVSLVPQGSLPRFEMKARRWVNA
ncbi:MAG TPA: AMP-binding protein [Bryobacteraceae bacterium]|jgi:phenylacetate-CoA ligase|nr:AMP-binding protein [Bryobacteraceae bacterium]